MSNRLSTMREKLACMTSALVALALCSSLLITHSFAQQTQRRSTPTLTSEDLMDNERGYAAPAAAVAPPARAPFSASSSSASSSTVYRDPAGAFTLSLPNSNWRAGDSKSQTKARLFDRRVFRKLDADGFASATASVYVLPFTATLPVGASVRLDQPAQRQLAETLAARFLSSNASVVSIEAASPAAFKLVADQWVARRAVVRALISAFEMEGKLYVVVCRAPVESFDQEAHEFLSITQSLASSVGRSSSAE